MIIKKELREERDDVFSFWMDVPIIESGIIIHVETKVDECTVLELKKRVSEFENKITELQERIKVEQTKINLING